MTTCSPANFSYVRSLGADAVFDYHSPAVADDIRAWSNDPDALTLAWDCAGAGDSPVICAAALSRTRAGHYRSVTRFDDEIVRAVNDRVDNGFRVAYTMFGEAFDKVWLVMPAVPEDYEYGKMFWGLARELLEQGKVKPARGDVNRGGEGLEGVLVGLRDLKEGKVSGVKLVYTL